MILKSPPSHQPRQASPLTVVSWVVDEVVTGPEKTITGTVASVNSAGRTVTLDAIESGWSANTGNYLLGKELAFTDDDRFTLQSFNAAIRSKNNSTEPITYAIKGSVGAKLLANPETSVITDENIWHTL